MFVKYPFISGVHKAALASVIAQHEIVTEPLLARLYQVALTAFEKGTASEPGICVHYIKAPAGIVAGATDERTGIYVQLSGPADKEPFLTAGQKWAMQAAAAGLSQIATRHW